MAVAWIGFGGAVIAAVISALVAVRQDALAVQQTQLQHELTEKLAQVQSDLDTERHKREAMIDRGLAAEDVLTRYREPLAAAAFELQSRIYNILRLDFFAKYTRRYKRAEDAVTTTLFRLAQYFGWTEILRRDIQYLSFPAAEETRRVARLQTDIAKCFITDRYGVELMLWTDEQRAIGEHMIVDEHDRVLCMGYARFRERHDEMLGQLCDRLRTDVTNPVVHARLRDAQHLLCDLVETLDSQRLRYTTDLERA